MAHLWQPSHRKRFGMRVTIFYMLIVEPIDLSVAPLGLFPAGKAPKDSQLRRQEINLLNLLSRVVKIVLPIIAVIIETAIDVQLSQLMMGP